MLGVAGIRYFLDCVESVAHDIAGQSRSCVPATELETSGARLEVADLLPLRVHPTVLGLAEVMNFPGVLAKDAGLPRQARRRSPAGISTAMRRCCAGCPQRLSRRRHPHRPRSTLLEEAREKLAKGMTVLMREGSIVEEPAPRWRRS